MWLCSSPLKRFFLWAGFMKWHGIPILTRAAGGNARRLDGRHEAGHRFGAGSEIGDTGCEARIRKPEPEKTLEEGDHRDFGPR